VISAGVVKLIRNSVLKRLQQEVDRLTGLNDAQKWQRLVTNLNTAQAEETYSMTQDEKELLVNQLNDNALVAELG
jgi:hypothetical protein